MDITCTIFWKEREKDWKKNEIEVYYRIGTIGWLMVRGEGERHESVLRHQTPHLIKFCCKARHSISPYYTLIQLAVCASPCNIFLLGYLRINNWYNFHGGTQIRHGLQNPMVYDLYAVIRVNFIANYFYNKLFCTFCYEILVWSRLNFSYVFPVDPSIARIVSIPKTTD